LIKREGNEIARYWKETRERALKGKKLWKKKDRIFQEKSKVM